MKRAVLALTVLVFSATAAPAQGWAEKMFKDGLSHDFGSVPRGAQLFHRFTITNIYAVRMEITEIRSGCGCVSATPSTRVLEPRQSATIDVSMDARRFTGAKTVAIRVSVGPEYVSSAELKVTANSRSDVVFNPGDVNFGVVSRGQTPSQTIDVEYAGVLNWQVSEIVAKDLPLDVSFKELYRRPGQVGYQVKVTLKADAPPGLLRQEILLQTNDPASKSVPILVEATVQAPLSVSPSSHNLGTVKAGDPLTRRVTVQGSKPFRVLSIEGLGEGVTLGAELAAAAAPVQTVTFKCHFDKAGDFKRELKIKTDLQEAPVVVTIEGTAAP
jgi:hypothetical protein